jgi:Holliday junction resolvase RusA-like endonuclease
MYRSPKYVAWRKQALWNVQVQAKGRRIIGPYKLTVLVVRPDKRKRDLDNLFKAASDVLVEIGVIEGDHLCEWLEARWVPSGAECEIMVEALSGEAV